MTPLVFTTQSAPAAAQPQTDAGTVVALFVVIAAVALWIALRAFIRGLRAKKTEAATGGDFAGFALEALVNAAKIDGRVNDTERQAIAAAMRELGGPNFDAGRVEKTFAVARLTKTELLAFLSARSRAFNREQKMTLLKALMNVFVADGNFDETEHAALMDYTAAIGFDRERAPQVLRAFTRGSIT